jgi:5'-phosphate synthase pdxT subunit
MKVGVLALQGDFEAHARTLARIGAAPLEVRTVAELASVDALVIPGGESTTIRKLAVLSGLIEPLRARAAGGMPILGTCAGMIACAREIADGDLPIVPLVDIAVRRNAYGRQVESFEDDVEFAGIGSVRAVFIRAPRIERVGRTVEVLAVRRGEPVAVRQGNALLVAFHPELTDDDRIHQVFLAAMSPGSPAKSD